MPPGDAEMRWNFGGGYHGADMLQTHLTGGKKKKQQPSDIFFWFMIIQLPQLTSLSVQPHYLGQTDKKTVQNPELILSQRCQTDDPVLLVSGFIPSVKNWDAGENMSERHSEREKQASSDVVALHCLLTRTVWPLRVNVSLKKSTKERIHLVL